MPIARWSIAPMIRCARLERIDPALAEFRGTFLQTPPPYSAKKVGGVAAYEMARKNEPVELEASRGRPCTTARSSLDIGTATSRELVRLRVRRAGFYVRSLAHDLGQVLGCGAHLEALRRTRVGRFRLEDAVDARRARSRDRGRAGWSSAERACCRTAGGHADRRRGSRAVHGNALGRQHLAGGRTAGAAGSACGCWMPRGAPLGRRTARRRAFASPPRPECKILNRLK